MAKNSVRTSKNVASKAGKVLNSSSNKTMKTLAASALNNRKPKTK